MKNLKSLFISGVAASGLMVSMHAFCATDMTPPKPIDNKVYDAMVGTWEGDSTMMGTKMHDVIKISWGLGHQFLIMQLKSNGIDNPKQGYRGMGMFGLDASGKAKTWWFDNWGAENVSTGSGNFDGTTLTLNDSNNKT